MVAGLIFAAIFVIHGARIAFEGPGALHDPFFVSSTIVALGAAIWSFVLLKRDH